LSLAATQAALLSAVAGRDEYDAALLASVRTHPNASADQRLAAYRANIKGAHLQALDQAYPVLREVLGPPYWRQLLESELTFFASSSPDLGAYGEFMPALLSKAQRRRPELRDLPYLDALATLEWRVHCARSTADDASFDWSVFSKLPEGLRAGARLQCSCALAVLHFDYPVDQIWRSHNGIEAGGGSETQEVYCCTHRIGRFGICVTRLDREDFEILRSIAAVPIRDLSGVDTDTLVQKIFRWIQYGWITGFRVDD